MAPEIAAMGGIPLAVGRWMMGGLGLAATLLLTGGCTQTHRMADPAATQCPAVGSGASPAVLSLMAAPAVLPADGGTNPALYLELLDARGCPALLPAPTTVALSSSDPAVAGTPATVTLPADTPALAVPVTTGSTAGNADLRATAPGLAPAQTELTTVAVGGAGLGGVLKLAFAPQEFFAGGTGPRWLTVELLRGAVPFLRAGDTRIQLVSSNPQAIGVPATATIPAGAFSVTVPIQVGHPGAATVTALYSGIGAGSASTIVHRTGGAPVALRATAVPGVILPGADARLVLQALDADNNPAPYPCGQVLLASSDPSVLGVAVDATPPCSRGQEAVVITTAPGSGTGATTVTAAMSGLAAAGIKVASGGTAPTRLVAGVAPAVPATGAPSAGWLVVQTIDAQGQPAQATREMDIALTASGGILPASVTIPPGGSMVAVPLGRIAPGASPQIAAAAPGLAPGTTLVGSAVGLGAVGRGPSFPAISVLGLHISSLWLFGGFTLVAAALVGLIAAGQRGLRRGSGGQ